MFLNLRYHTWGFYSPKDSNLIKHIAKLYKAHLCETPKAQDSTDPENLKELPEVFLEVIPGTPEIKKLIDQNSRQREINRETISETYWHAKIGNGDLKIFAQELINYINNEQLKRIQRMGASAKENFLGAGHLNDPIGLLLYAIKVWAAIKLSGIKTSDSDDCRTNIEKIGNYNAFLDALISTMTLDLYTFITHGEEFERLKSNIKKIMEILSSAKEHLRLCVLKNCSREHFNSVAISLLQVVRNGMNVAYYIFQEKVTMPSFLLEQLVFPGNGNEDKAILKTQIGTLLRACFSLDFNPYKDYFPRPESTANSANVSLFPLDLGSTKVPSAQEILDSVICTNRKLSFGMLEEIANESLKNKYLNFVTNLIKIAFFRGVNAIFFDMSGIGGDLNVYQSEYSASKNTIIDDYSTFIELLDETTILVQELFGEVHSFHHKYITNENFLLRALSGRARSIQNWVQNHKCAQDALPEFLKILTKCKNTANEIIASAKAFDEEKAQHKMVELKSKARDKSNIFLSAMGKPIKNNSAAHNRRNEAPATVPAGSSSKHDSPVDAQCDADMYEAWVQTALESKNYAEIIDNCSWFLDNNHQNLKANGYELPESLLNFSYHRGVAYYNLALTSADSDSTLDTFRKALQDVDTILKYLPNDIEAKARELQRNILKKISPSTQVSPHPSS